MIFPYLIWTTVFVLFLALLQWFFNTRIRYAPIRKFPGVAPTFLMGNISWVVRLYSKKLDFHPGVYILNRIIGSCVLFPEKGMHAFWFGFRPIVSVYKAEVLEAILSSNISLKKSFEYTFLHQWLGTGLLTSSGSKWRTRRKLLTSSFHFRILEDFVPVFNDQSLILVKKLRSLSDEEFVDITPMLVLCTLDVVCETVMGVRIGAQGGSNSEYVRAIHNLGDFFNKRTVRPWLWSDFLFNLTSSGKGYAADIAILHNFTDKVIKEKKQKLLAQADREDAIADEDKEFQPKKRQTFMDLLLDMHMNGQQLSEGDIREEVDTFMFEGHDTTAMSLTYALYCIGLYPEVQTKVVEELESIFGDDRERPITPEDLRSMKYLECTLKETQRLFPAVPLIGRDLAEDIHHGGLTIPKGTTVHCNIYGLHRDPQVYPEPEIFDPDRFLQETSMKRHPYAFIPFSAGPRNCIGQKFAIMEEKTMISNILRHFHVKSLDPRDKVHTVVEFTLRPAQAMRLKFVPR